MSQPSTTSKTFPFALPATSCRSKMRNHVQSGVQTIVVASTFQQKNDRGRDHTSSGLSTQRCSRSNGSPAAFQCSTSGSGEVVSSDSDVFSHIARSAAASSGLAEACTPLSEPLGCAGNPRLSHRCRMSDRRLPAPAAQARQYEHQCYHNLVSGFSRSLTRDSLWMRTATSCV